MSNENGEWIIHGVEPNDPKRIKSADKLMEYVNEIGFIPLFRNEIPGFSVEERTIPNYWWSGDEDNDPWTWREMIARTGQMAYGKFFDNRAGFISKEWFPYFANFRRKGYDFDALWEDEKISRRCKKVMDLFAEDSERFSNEVKATAGFGTGGEKNFEGTVTSLQMQMYLIQRDFKRRTNKKGDEYGWPVTIFSCPEHIWGYKHVTSAYGEDPFDSAQRIRERIVSMYPEADEKAIIKMIGK